MTRVLRTPHRAVPLLVAVLALAAIAAIIIVQNQAAAARRAQISVGSVEFALADLENATFAASPLAGGSPPAARAEIAADESSIMRLTGTLISAGSAPGPLRAIPAQLRALEPTAMAIYRLGASPRGYDQTATDPLQAALFTDVGAMMGRLRATARAYAHRADVAKADALVGSAATILVLVLLFTVFYRRASLARAAAERLSRENGRLLEASREEAMTDPLTGLRNRRALERDMEALSTDADDGVVAAIFDLNGFKQYNDAFGHAAGDALLARLGGSLRRCVGSAAGVYRLGGDEFCLLARGAAVPDDGLVRAAAGALTDRRGDWDVDCSWGMARTPQEAGSVHQAIRLADQRMYAHKATGRLDPAAALG